MLQFIDKLSNGKRVLVIAAVLLLGVASLALGVARIHATGVPVVLATVPVDPRSLFQGDYVVLRYEINQLDGALFDESEVQGQYKSGQTVYVELQPGELVWTPVQARLRPFAPAQGHVMLKGTTQRNSWSPVRNNEPSKIGVRYGIESFFVPEGEGRVIERMGWNNQSRVTVQALVAPDGAALPHNILVDGKPAFADAGMN